MKKVVQFETGDVLKFITEQGTYSPGQVIILRKAKSWEEIADFQIIGSSNPHSWGGSDWLQQMFEAGDIVYMGNIGPVE